MTKSEADGGVRVQRVVRLTCEACGQQILSPSLHPCEDPLTAYLKDEFAYNEMMLRHDVARANRPNAKLKRGGDKPAEPKTL